MKSLQLSVPIMWKQQRVLLNPWVPKGSHFLMLQEGEGRRGIIRAPDPEGTVRRDVGVYLMQQRGIIHDANEPKYHVPVQREIELGFLPKKMLMIVVNDDEVPHIIDALTQINRSGQKGDGKIFVCPMTDAVRIRTGERGKMALSQNVE